MNSIIVMILITGILSFFGCSSSGWSEETNSIRDLPWCGPGKKIILETKTTSAPFSTTGYQTHWRWVCNQRKYSPTNYARQIDEFLLENGYMEKWPKSGSYVGTDNGSKQLIRAPYIIEFASVNPLVVFMRPKTESDGKTYRGDLLTSAWLTNYYYYGTQFIYQSETLWFSPDLKQLPTPLDLQKGSEISLNLGDSSLYLTENEGHINILRK